MKNIVSKYIPIIGISVIILLITGFAFLSCDRSKMLSDTEIYYTIDLTKPETGKTDIMMTMKNLPKGDWTIYQLSAQDVINVTNVKATTPSGEELTIKESRIARPKRTIINNKTQDVTITYEAKPGGSVKHGSQGYMCEKYALVTGSIFLTFWSQIAKEKDNYSGTADIKKVIVDIKTKPEWTIATSLAETDEGYDPAVNGKWIFSALKYSNIAVGNFEKYEKKFGSVLSRLYVFADWEESEKEEIVKNSFNIYEVFHKQAPFDSLPVYTTIFTPGDNKNKRVMGNIWATGQAYSYSPYKKGGFERTPRRVWELYAHRISHAINRYEICGTHTPNKYERWLDEGWASWVEITHTLEAGAVESDVRFDELWRWYSRVFHGKDKRNDDVPVYMESQTYEHNIIRYLHYFKGPLVAQFLDYEIKRLSDGKKSLNGFIKYYYPKYKNHKAPVPQLKELNKYMAETGTTMNYFYEDYVKKTGYFYPIYEGFLERCRNKKISKNKLKTPLKVNDFEVTQYQYDSLKRFLNGLGIKNENDIKDRLTEMILVLEEYKNRKLNIIPKEMMELYPKLPADVQVIMFEHQKSIMFTSDPEYKRWLRIEKDNLSKLK